MAQRVKTYSTALKQITPSGEERNYNPVGYKLCISLGFSEGFQKEETARLNLAREVE